MTFLNIIFFLMILYGIVAFIMTKVDETGKLTTKKLFVKPTLLVGIVLFILSLCIVKVGGQEVGVLITPAGVSDTPLYTGWHFVLPIINKVEYMDKTIWVYSLTQASDEGQKQASDAVWSPTRDGMQVGLDISVSWRIDVNQAPWVYQNVSEADGGPDAKYIWIEENIIRPKIKSALASTVSEYTIIEVYGAARHRVQMEVQAKLKDELKEFRLLIEQVNIRELFFQKEFENSINQKKIAEQEVMRLIEVTKQREEYLKQETINKDIAIQKAMGESKALQIKGQSISENPKIIQLEWINKWNGDVPKVIGGGNSMFLMDIGGF